MSSLTRCQPQAFFPACGKAICPYSQAPPNHTHSALCQLLYDEASDRELGLGTKLKATGTTLGSHLSEHVETRGCSNNWNFWISTILFGCKTDLLRCSKNFYEHYYFGVQITEVISDLLTLPLGCQYCSARTGLQPLLFIPWRISLISYRDVLTMKRWGQIGRRCFTGSNRRDGRQCSSLPWDHWTTVW